MTGSVVIDETIPQLVAVANTGPIVSAFQSRRVDLRQAVFRTIYGVPSTVLEYEQHGAGDLLAGLIKSGLVMTLPLSPDQEVRAVVLAQQIALSPLSRDAVVANHIPAPERRRRRTIAR